MKSIDLKTLKKNKTVQGLDTSLENIKEHAEGYCPICSSEELEAGSLEITKQHALTYKITCLDCGFEGKELYSLTFKHYIK